MMDALGIQDIHINKVELYFASLLKQVWPESTLYKFNNTLFFICDTANSIVHT